MTSPLDPHFSEKHSQNNEQQEELRSPLRDAPSSNDLTHDAGDKTPSKREQASSLQMESEASKRTSPSSREKLRRQRLLEKREQKEAKKNELEQSRRANRKKEKVQTKRLRVRLIPIWVRIFLILLLSGGALIGGAMVGYGMIGKGNPSDVLKMQTWTHIRDVIYAKK